MQIYVGADVHSKSTTYEAQNGGGEILATGTVPTSLDGFLALKQRCQAPDGSRVALESGGLAYYAAKQIAAAGLEPVVVDAFEVRRKAHRPKHKSDARDAHELCEGIRRDLYRAIVHIPPAHIQVLRELLSRRRHFLRVMTRQVNAAKFQLRANGIPTAGRRLNTSAGWDRLMEHLPEEGNLRLFLEQHRGLWQCARSQVELLEKRLDEAAAPVEREVALLRTIPGVGRIVATTAVAVLSDVNRFPSVREAASYAGIVPSTHQSGDRSRHGRITKRGSTELRSMLCEAAHQAARKNSPLHPQFARLCARRGYKQATIAMAHRILRIIYAMLRDGRPFELDRVATARAPDRSRSERRYVIRRAAAVTTEA